MPDCPCKIMWASYTNVRIETYMCAKKTNKVIIHNNNYDIGIVENSFFEIPELAFEGVQYNPQPCPTYLVFVCCEKMRWSLIYLQDIRTEPLNSVSSNIFV
jgi:hypothetical protein